jgi:hypothetical protein
LSGAERAVVIESIQEFQLDENAQRRRLLERTRTLDVDFVRALRLFIKEEQRHSALLGRFLKAQSSPCLYRHWIHAAFRRVRGWTGLGAHASAGDGRSARHPLLPLGEMRPDRRCCGDLRPNISGRNGTGHGTRHALMLSDGDHAAGLDGTQAGVPRRRIFATATLDAKPYRW